MLVFQPSRSMIWAVGPELFMAWADTRYWPSGDQLSLSTCVVPPHWDMENGEIARSSACKPFRDKVNKNKMRNRESKQNGDLVFLMEWELTAFGERYGLTSLKGLVMLFSSCQSMVLQTFRLWSSAWDAMYLPTGSHVRPLTSPVCPFKVATISVQKERQYYMFLIL